MAEREPPELPTTPQDTRTWRVGQHYGIHLYAVRPDGDDEPLATTLDPRIAEQIVAEHTLCTAPYADPEHLGGSWVQMLGYLASERMRLLRELAQARNWIREAQAEFDKRQGLWRPETRITGE